MGNLLVVVLIVGFAIVSGATLKEYLEMMRGYSGNYEHRNVDQSVVEEAVRIGNLIRQGGFACLSGQYKPLFICLIPSTALLFSFFDRLSVIGFIFGFLGCLSIVYLALDVATIANVVTSLNCASDNGLRRGFQSSFSAGKCISGYITALMLFFMLLLVIIREFNAEGTTKLTFGFTLGGSLIAMFSRLGGGVFTKSADVSGDLIGKIILDLPEDSPNNPAVIADNIGDNIGDCVGAAADIFDSYLCALLLNDLFPGNSVFLIALFSAISSSLFSIFTVRLKSLSNTNKEEGSEKIINIMTQLFTNSFLLAPFLFIICNYLVNPYNFIKDLISFLVGLFLLIILLLINFHYVSIDRHPVKKICEASKNGTAMNIITGLYLALEASFSILASVVTTFAIGYYINGYRGAVTTLFTLLGFIPCIMTMDAYGPVVDNAGGLVVMSGGSGQARHVTDTLDALGNLSKALTKGYSSGITILTGVLLFCPLFKKIKITEVNIWTMVGGFLGASLSYLFAGIVIKAVYRGAEYMSKITLFKLKNETPDRIEYYTQPIKSLALKSIQYSFPALVIMFLPMLCFLVGLRFRIDFANFFIVGILLGITFSGLILGQMMTIGGAAWDNAKKLAEPLYKEEELKISGTIEQTLLNLQNMEKSHVKPQYDFDSLESIYTKLDKLVPGSFEILPEINALKEDLRSHISSIRVKQKLIDSDYTSIVKDLKRVDLRSCLALLEDEKTKTDLENDTTYNKEVYELFKTFKNKLESKKIRDSVVTGDIIGDPLKDAAGVSLNNLAKFVMISIMFVVWCVK
jgi:K(+)-stimulated pyrophosphate-energized sodium pump